MGNQQNLSPRVAERVFEAVFPSFMALWFSGRMVDCLSTGTGSTPVGVVWQNSLETNKYVVDSRLTS